MNSRFFRKKSVLCDYSGKSPYKMGRYVDLKRDQECENSAIAAAV